MGFSMKPTTCLEISNYLCNKYRRPSERRVRELQEKRSADAGHRLAGAGEGTGGGAQRERSPCRTNLSSLLLPGGAMRAPPSSQGPRRSASWPPAARVASPGNVLTPAAQRLTGRPLRLILGISQPAERKVAATVCQRIKLPAHSLVRGAGGPRLCRTAYPWARAASSHSGSIPSRSSRPPAPILPCSARSAGHTGDKESVGEWNRWDRAGTRHRRAQH